MNSSGFPGSSEGKESACKARDLVLIPGLKGPLEKEMATHSSLLAGRIPWTKELGELHGIPKSQTQLSD